MATFRVGVGSFNIKDGAVGFGTEIDGLGNLRVKGVTKTTGSIVSGASTLTRYSGFAADNINQLENITLTSEVGTIGDIVVGVGTSVIISSASTVTVGTVESVSIGTHFSPPVGGIEDRGEDFVEGMMRFNTDLNTMEFYNGNEWRQFNYQSDIKNSPGSRGRGVLGGSTGDGQLIHYINISSQGNSVDFGLLTNGKSELNGMSDGTRGLFANGYQSTSPATRLNDIEYITIASEGDAIDFGDSTMKRNSGDSGCSSGTRGVMGGGYTANNSPANPQNVIDYVEIQTLGNALDFGDLAYERYGHGACSSPTRGLFGGGGESPAGAQKDITFITIASKGNSVQFGNLTKRRMYHGSSGNSVRGLFGGGYTSGSADGQKTIDYVTIASEGNAIDFGERTQGGSYGSATASQTRFVMFGSRAPSVDLNIIDFVNIASTGDAIDFGDISWSTGNHAIGALSDSHGGLGGF